jgi:hypothetical protein
LAAYGIIDHGGIPEIIMPVMAQRIIGDRILNDPNAGIGPYKITLQQVQQGIIQMV